MKCSSLLLIFGVLLLSFHLHCEAFEYRDSRHYGRSLLEAENTIDEVRHHRYRRDVRLTNETDCQNNSLSCNDTTAKENHKYYVSQVIKNGQKYWIDVQGNNKSLVHPYLSDSYLLTQVYKLSFKFPYYGHLLDEVMLTTGGFLYMDVHDTKLITQAQYLAPLMAYFNPHLRNGSKVYTLEDESKLTVEWYNVHLNENFTDEAFTFQCTLHKDGTIWFAYKQIPIAVGNIPALPYHPVKVGIADAFVIRRLDTRINILFRYFYIYSTINIPKDSVVNNAAVIFKPLLSCVSAKTCTACIERTAVTNFTCEWCTKTEKCSDGADRHRQEWEENKCNDNSIKEINEVCRFGPKKEERNLTEEKTEEKTDLQSCVSAQTCTACIERTAATNFTCEWCTKIEKCSDGADRHRQEWEENKCNDNSIKEINVCRFGPKKEERKTEEKTEEKKGIGAGAIVAIVFVLVIITGIAAWCVYAYRHPTSKSGLIFIEASRRPREFFRRSPGTSGTTADPSDIKPQVL